MKRSIKITSERGASTFSYSLLLVLVTLSVVWAFGPDRVVSMFLQENMTFAADGIAGGSTVGTTASGEIPSTTGVCQTVEFIGEASATCIQPVELD